MGQSITRGEGGRDNHSGKHKAQNSKDCIDTPSRDVASCHLKHHPVTQSTEDQQNGAQTEDNEECYSDAADRNTKEICHLFYSQSLFNTNIMDWL